MTRFTLISTVILAGAAGGQEPTTDIEKKLVEKVIEPTFEMSLRAGVPRLLILDEPVYGLDVPEGCLSTASVIELSRPSRNPDHPLAEFAKGDGEPKPRKSKYWLLAPQAAGVTTLTIWEPVRKGIDPVNAKVMCLVRIIDGKPKKPTLSKRVAGFRISQFKPVPMTLPAGSRKVIRFRKEPSFFLHGTDQLERRPYRPAAGDQRRCITVTHIGDRAFDFTADVPGIELVTLVFGGGEGKPQILQYEVTAKYRK